MYPQHSSSYPGLSMLSTSRCGYTWMMLHGTTQTFLAKSRSSFPSVVHSPRITNEMHFGHANKPNRVPDTDYKIPGYCCPLRSLILTFDTGIPCGPSSVK